MTKFIKQLLGLVSWLAIFYAPAVMAQTPSEYKAQGLFYEAEKALTQEQYDKALDLSSQARDVLGSNNALLQSIDVRALYGAQQYLKAQVALSVFYTLNPKEGVIKKVAPILAHIDDKAEKEQLRIKGERQAEALKEAQEAERQRQFDLELLLANQGDAEAQYNIGLKFEKGEVVPQSDSNALSWYNKAVDQNHPKAQHKLGNMYLHGKGVPQSELEASKLYRKSAEQGYVNGMHNMGNIYANGKVVDQSYTEAVKWYRKSADQGFALSQAVMGNMYAEGNGVPKSDTEAVKWYRKAVDQGNAYGQLQLGYMYSAGSGVPKNDAESVKWYRKAAELY